MTPRDVDARVEAVVRRINDEFGGSYTADDVNVRDHDWDFGKTTDYITPEGEFWVMTEKESYEYLAEDVEELIDDLGIYGLFGKGYSDYVADNFVSWSNGRDYMYEDYESYYDDIENESASDDRFETRCQEELYEKVGDEEDIETWLASYEDNRELYVERVIESIIDEYSDPLEWAIDNFGKEFIKRLIDEGEVEIDYDGIAEWTADIDGFGRIASYDGEDWEDDESDFHVYRMN